MSRVTRLTIVLVLNLGLIAGLIIVGLRAHSLGVLAEGGDYLADAAAIAVTLLAIWLSDRPPTPKRPHGYPRATRFAALINAGWLLVLSLLVATVAIHRLATGATEVRGLPVLAASGIAAIVMLVDALILGGDIDDDDEDDDDLHLRAVILDTAADAAAAAAAGVAVTSGIIFATSGWYWLDPTVALVIAFVIAFQTVRLLREVGSALRAQTMT